MSIKPLTLKTHLIFWAVTFSLFICFLLLFKSVLLPFVLGMAVAYLLNPVVNTLGQVGFSRKPATISILGGFMILVVAFFGVIGPILYREIGQFSNDLPLYIEKIGAILAPYTERLQAYTGASSQNDLESILKENSASAVKVANFIVGKLAAGGQAIFDMLSIIIFMPIVAYFMMIEWPRIVAWVKDLLPRHSKDLILELLKEIDQKLSGFVRGQITVAFFLGVSYAIALTIAGLKYGFMIGLLSGFLSIIPMVGSAVGLIISVAVAWFQSSDLLFVGIIGAIFIIGQLIEGNILTPKLVGDSVGLHPLWVFFALLAGGSVLGILGMFLAVPVAAVIGVLLGFAIKKYKQSSYYEEKLEQEDSSKPAVKDKKSKKTEVS